jgi:hypothetical protein
MKETRSVQKTLTVAALLLLVIAACWVETSPGGQPAKGATLEWKLDARAIAPDGQSATGAFVLKTWDNESLEAFRTMSCGDVAFGSEQTDKALLASIKVLSDYLNGTFYMGERSPLTIPGGQAFTMDEPGVYTLTVVNAEAPLMLSVSVMVGKGPAEPLPPKVVWNAAPGDVSGYVYDPDPVLVTLQEDHVPLAAPAWAAAEDDEAEDAAQAARRLTTPEPMPTIADGAKAALDRRTETPFQSRASIEMAYDGELHLTDTISLTATVVEGIDGKPVLRVQWQNDTNGESWDLPAAPGTSVQYGASRTSPGYSWSVQLKPADAD